MTAPLPPTSGPVPLGEKTDASMQGGTGPEIEASLPDLAGIAQAAQSAGEAWNAGGAKWADSPQGAGLDGFTLGGDTPSGADGSWDPDVLFPHQGP